MAVTTHARLRAPRARSRRAFRCAALLPAQPLGVEVLAAVRRARLQQGRALVWDARLESSLIAVFAYLWRRGRGEKWAGRNGSARYGCSLAQLVMGLSPIMGWQGIPERQNEAALRRFIKRHRKSVQRWLDWLELAGLVAHTPQQDEQGFWWRTIIQLHPCPQLSATLLAEAVKRRAGWPQRERQREARGRQRNLTAILRRARLSPAQRRARSILRRRELAQCAQRSRVRLLAAESLARAAKTHLTHPFGASTTSRSSPRSVSDDETFHRRLTRARKAASDHATHQPTQTTASERTAAETGKAVRWAVYHEILATRLARSDQEERPCLMSAQRRVAELLDWPEDRECPRWRLIEAWTVAAHGHLMTVAGGFRLAFWAEPAQHHGPRLERALTRYQRFAQVRPPGWPQSPVAALAWFLTEHTPRQDGPEHGMAYDIARFSELTKQMSAYAHYMRPAHLDLATKRAARRQQAQRLAEQLNQRLRFRVGDRSTAAKLRVASQLLSSDHPTHQAAGRAMCAHTMHKQQLAERDQRLLAGEHPGDNDGCYQAAYRYAQRWGLLAPAAQRAAGSYGSTTNAYLGYCAPGLAAVERTHLGSADDRAACPAQRPCDEAAGLNSPSGIGKGGHHLINTSALPK